jgi:hypothetical protein
MEEAVKIDAEFSNLIPEITVEEKDALKKSILEEGCRDPLVKWGDILLDGHNRYEICTRHKVEFRTIRRKFDSRNQAKLWIINNQLGRRNLTREQSSNLRGIRYELEKRKKGGQIPGSRVAQNEQSITTADKIGKETGVSAGTIRRDAQFSKALNSMPPELRDKVLAGRSGLTKKQVSDWPKMSEEQREAVLKGEKGSDRKKRNDRGGSGKKAAGHPTESSGNDLPPTQGKEGYSGTGKKLPVLGPPCVAMHFAREAIRDLEQIPKDDAERAEALYYLQQWLEMEEYYYHPIESLNESENLWLLKTIWEDTKRRDRKAFLGWIEK